MDGARVADPEEVPEDSTLLLTLREGFDETEAILVRLNGEVACWRNYCQHWTDVRLDKGSGAPVRDGELVCRKHAATFDGATGECTHGPCEGAFLEEVDVEVRDDGVYLTDPDYEFVRRGPAETERDLSTNPGDRLGF